MVPWHFVLTLEFSPIPGYPQGMPQTPWYLYVVRCGDGSLYAGVTCDLPRRLVQHQQGRGARYTRGRGPLSLAARAAFRPRVCKCRVDAGCKTAAREIANPGILVPAATTVRSITASPTLLNMAFSRLIPLAVRAHSRHAARSRRFCS